MEEDGKTLPDFDPKIPDAAEFSPPKRDIGAAAQTPPPSSSDAPTMVHVSGVPVGGAPSSPVPSFVASGSLPLLFQPGMVIGGRYRILRILGEGGMGAVYQARDQELERVIALKVIRPELAGNASILQRFKQELILARHVTHKNVIRIYDLGEADGVKFITMEYVEGEDLRGLLRRQTKLAPGEAVDIIIQICRALDCAHGVGVIHRDLKPQNVMRDPNGRIVVMDFGLARSLESPGMTQTGALVGTLEYMSPEQAMGGDLDQRSDLFAVGLIFYELLTGKVPYKAETGIASLMKRTQERAVPVFDVDNTVPRALSTIVSKCLERDPNQRFHSAMDLLRQLEAWQGNPNITPSTLVEVAPPAPRSVQISLTLPGRRGWIWVAAAVAVLILPFAIPQIRHRIFPSSSSTMSGDRGIPDISKGKYVAVLPLKVMGDENSLRYVADGLVDALSAKMFQLQEVHVASSSAVEKVAAEQQSIEKTARALGVNLILEGMVQGNADKLRVTLNLENVADNHRVWTKEFSGVPQDLLTLEDEIYADLVDALNLKPTNDELARSGVHPTENTTAYDLYLKGRNALRGTQGVRDTQAGLKLLEDALKQDPNFALAYTGVADANLRLYRDTNDSLYAQKAIAAAQRAEQLSPNLPEVHLALGSAYDTSGRSAEAIRELKTALELAPNSDDAYRRMGDALRASGKKAEAIAAYQSAVNANPYYWYNHDTLGSAYFRYGDTEKALEEYQRVTELAPDNAVGYQNTGAVYFRRGDYEKSIPFYQKALEIEPHASIYSNLGTAYFFLKRYEEAIKMFEKAVESNPKDEQLLGNLADTYRASGNMQQAVATYDKAIGLAYQQLQVNPRSADVMGDLALYYAKKGDSKNAQQYIRQARAITPADLQLLYSEVQINAITGQTEQAMHSLEEALQKGYSAEEAQRDPELDKLQSLPEFSRLMNQYIKK
jgi:serine/threonine protein kinase/tetratricopeptide (TPR) repeat protein